MATVMPSRLKFGSCAMKSRDVPVLFFMLILAWSAPLLAQSRAELQRLDELDRRCEAARDAVLPAIIEWKVEDCVRHPPSPRARPMTREQCVAYWSDFGTMQRQRAALQLTECEVAFEARKRHRQRSR
jgi:hypothetical protein